MLGKNQYTPWSSDSINAKIFSPCSFTALDTVTTSISTRQFSTAELICHNIHGNFLLQDDTKYLEIWKEQVFKNNTVSITLFNSSHSGSSVEVHTETMKREVVTFKVPPGNSLSRTIEGAHSIMINRIGEEQSDGKFCLDVCLTEYHRDKYIYEKRTYKKHG